MPYGISDSQSDCSGWAAVKQNEDGTFETIGCHETKQEAINQMVAASVSEDIEPLGEVNSRELRAEGEILVADIDGTLLADGNEPIASTIEAVNANEYPLVLLTGRVESDRDATVEALSAAGVRQWVRLVMHSADENEQIPLYKRDVVEQLVLEGYEIDAFVDNDEANRAAVAELGVDVYSPEQFVSDEAEEMDEPEDTGEPEMDSRRYTSHGMATVTESVHWVSNQHDEKRSIAYTNLELREVGDGNTFVGYAAVFDSPSEPMPFIEYVRKGAFAKTLKDGADVRFLIDHEGVPLARTKSGTLSLTEDERGLRVEASLDPMNPDAQRVISAMRRGDLSQMSFAFRTIKDSWNSDYSVRELKEVQLYDVSVVTYPAYEATVAELRRVQHDTVAVTSPVLLRQRQLQIARHR